MSSQGDPMEAQAIKLGKILIVDDEEELTSALCEMLGAQRYEASGFNNPLEALNELREHSYDILLADLMMPEMDGITLLKKALEIDPDIIGIIMTGQGTVQTAVEAMKSGALDYILKPFKVNAILSTLSRAIEVHRLRMENVQLRELLNIYELGQVVAFTLDSNIIFHKTAEAALKECQADEVSILVPEGDDNDLVIASAYGMGREQLVGVKVPMEGTVAGWVARHRETLMIEGEINDPRFPFTHPRADILNALSMPMVLGNKLVGVINLNMVRHQRAMTEGQIKGLRVLLSIAASALENARLYSALRQELSSRSQRERELEAIASLGSELRRVGSREEMIPIVLDKVSEILETEAAAISIVDTGSEESVIEDARGEWSQRTGERIRPGEEIQGDPVPSASIPLIAEEKTMGVLWIARQAGLLEADSRLLTSIGDMVAGSIQRASLFDQTRKQLHRVTALRTIDLAISSSLDLRITLNVLLDQVSSELNVDAAAVLLFVPNSQILEYSAGRGFHTDLLSQSKTPVGVGLAGTAAFERRTIQVTNLATSVQDPLWDGLITMENFQSCWITPLVSKGQVKGVLEVFQRKDFLPDAEWLDFFEALAGQAAIAIESAQLFDSLQQSNQQLTLAYQATIEGWSRALDLRDRETEGHTQRVTETALRLARAIGVFDEDDLVHIRRGALLHDIGKMGVPDAILLKPGTLTEEEWVIMMKHPDYAFQLLSPIVYLRKALDIPYAHHEKWDGTGYPQGLKEHQIPLAARIFAVVDVWDALRSDRPYRPGWSNEQVNQYLREKAGSHFDPQVVESFLKMLET
jgi:response regulator RpfG family c-di-GMP phosphodiesterase